MTMRLGIIGGTGTGTLFTPDGESPDRPREWPCGPPSAPPRRCLADGRELLFLPRHGEAGGPRILPHQVNYRANVRALRDAGADRIVGINAVGGIAPWAVPGTLVLPDQLIDYTWGREHSYAGSDAIPEPHVDFSAPFDAALRSALAGTAARLGIGMPDRATYGVTQGPRLETAAEIDRLERDGCHVVGMTAMPEAALARELGIAYAICCVVVNPAAGREPAGSRIHDGMAVHLEAGLRSVRQLVAGLLASQ